jgi:hypothetical protein
MMDVPISVLAPGEAPPPNVAPLSAPAFTLTPPTPETNRVVTCRVAFPGVCNDPNLDLIRYRYEWAVNGVPARSYTSAARVDYFPAGWARPGDRLTCRVSESDGALDSATNQLEVFYSSDSGCGATNLAVGVALTDANTAVQVSWLSNTQRNYRVQFRRDLTQGDWQSLGEPGDGSGQQMSFFDAWTSSSQKFFRALSSEASAVVQVPFIFTTNNGTLTITGYIGNGGLVNIPGTIGNLTVTSIGAAFSGCSTVTGVTIPDSVTSIGNNAFLNCTGLTGVSIPCGVTNIGVGAFGGCTSLPSIDVDDVNSWFISLDGVLFNASQTMLVQYPAGRSGGYTIPNGVTSILESAFFYCAALTDVVIPDGVTTIRNWTFSGCSSLTNVSIPASTTTIGNKAFYSCTRLAGVTIPPSVASLGLNAFSLCTNLTHVCFTGNAPSLGSDVFGGDTNVTVFCLSGTAGWVAPFGGLPLVTYATNSGQASITGYKGSCLNVTVPSALAGLPVAGIGEGAFSNCVTLTKITIPGDVTSVGPAAFHGCTGLVSVCFKGNAPGDGSDLSVFAGDTRATVYRLPGTTNWGTVFDGRPVELWGP